MKVVIWQLDCTRIRCHSVNYENKTSSVSNDSYNSFNANVTGNFTPNMFIGGTVDKKFTWFINLRHNYKIFEEGNHVSMDINKQEKKLWNFLNT
jgi:hypothetical protein